MLVSRLSSSPVERARVRRLAQSRASRDALLCALALVVVVLVCAVWSVGR